MPTTSPDRVEALSAEADLARRDGRYDDAALLFREALTLAEATLGADDPLLVDVLNRVGMLGKYTGDHAGAEVAYARALTIEAARAVPRASVVATLLHNIGGLAHARAQFADAAIASRRGLALRRQIGAPDDPDVASDEGALAAILVDLGELDEARALAEHARAVLGAAFGADDHDAVAALAVLATAFHRGGDEAAALTTYVDVVRAKERTLGRDHPELVATLNNIAVLHAKQGRLDEAALAYERAWTILDVPALAAHPYRDRIAANRDALQARRSAP